MLNKTKSIIICCFFIIAAVNLFSESFLSQYIKTVWTTNQGLASDTINDVLQDKNGFIMIATYEGLVRFDGIKFELINKYSNPDFNSVSARVLLEDKDGALWVGTNGDGVAQFKNNKITMFTVKDGLPDNSIRSIAEDKIGRIWIGTTKGVSYIFEGKVIKVEEKDKISYTELAELIFCDNSGKIWVAFDSPGLHYFDNDRHLVKSDMVSDKYTITEMYNDKNGDLWLGTKEKGVLLLRNGSLTVFNEKSGFKEGKVNHIMKTHNGKLWFGTDSGIITYDGAQTTTYSEKDGLTNNIVEKIIEDREGNIWIATSRGGVEKLSKSKFLNYGVKEGLIHNTVNSVETDSKGKVWIGTDIGLSCFNNGKFENNVLTEYLKGIRIRHILSAGQETLFISAYSDLGFIISDKYRISKYTAKEGLTGNRIRVSYKDSKGNIWIGTTNGLNKLNSDGKITQIKRSDGLTYDYIMCIIEDLSGAIWVGTDGGGVNILRANGSSDSYSIERLDTENGLAGNIIFRIYEEANGVKWITTGSGISRIEGPKIVNYNSGSGLSSDSVFQILEDNFGRVWMTSNKGVSYCKKFDLEAIAKGANSKINVINLDKNDGLKAGVTSTSWSEIDNSGNFWFPTLEGVSIIDVSNIYINQSPPLVEVKSLKLDDKTVEANKKIVIEAGVKRITIDYTGLSFTVPEKVLFSYKLEGFDKEFSAPVSYRSTSYTNLSPGVYTFKIKAANNDGVWSDPPITFSIDQKPYIYQELWFYILLLLALSGAVYGIYRARVRRLKRRQVELEKIVKSRTEDLQNEKEKSETLLLNILPLSIAKRLKSGENTIADKFENTTIIFADLVDFTKLSSSIAPYQLLYCLNAIFSEFDQLTEIYGIEKIKTLGDSYMAAAGVPEYKENHAETILNFAFDIQDKVKELNEKLGMNFQMRIGINSGPVVAGVIGKKKFIYDMWGDAVNVASRMERLAAPGKIHVSSYTRNLLSDKYRFEEVGEIEVKGKGLMTTYNVLK